MPLINKVRIVNFAYNNDNRIIPDTTLDFKNQDTLITLQNGGGKSIMAQTIMQPILPLCSLGNNAKKRTFDKIFRKDKEPSYILIEWKLDNNAGYMTCGIAVKRANGSEEEDERRNSLDYYTFILDRSFTDINITNLKLSTWDGTKLNIKDYYDTKDFIESRGGKVYKSDSEFYKNNLMSYNIYPKEWKSIITKINGDEGGLLKLFENSITSKDLVVNWILKTIKETLAASTNMTELSEQTENHIKKARRRLEDRKNREILNKYTNSLSEFEKDVVKLKEISQKTEESIETLYSLKYTITDEVKKFSDEAINFEGELIEIESALKEIGLQIESKKYYDMGDNRDILIRERDELLRRTEALNEELDKKKRLLTSLKVAEINGTLKSNREDLAKYQARIDKLSMEATEIDRELENLGYTINSIYEKEEKEVKDRLKDTEVKLEEASKEIEDVNSSLKEAKGKRDILIKESTECGVKIKYLDGDIKEILQNVEYTNMFLATNPEEIDKEISTIEVKANEAQKRFEDNLNVLKNLKADEEKNERKLNSVREEISRLNSEAALSYKDLEAYNNTIAQLTSRLDDYSIEFSLKSKAAAILKLEAKSVELENAIVRSEGEIRECEQMIDRLSSGGVEINHRFLEYLDGRNLSYVLGSDYLKKSIDDEALRREYLKKVPLLPYSIIMDREVIEYLKADMPKEYYKNLSVIIEREKMGSSLEPQGPQGLIEIAPGNSVLALYDEDLAVKDDLNKEKQELKSKIDVLNSNIGKWKSQERALSFIKNDIENLAYDEESEKNLRNRLKTIETSITDLEKTLEDINGTIAILKENEVSFGKENEELKEAIRSFNSSVSMLTSLKIKVIDKKDAYLRVETLKGDIKIAEETIALKEGRQRELETLISDLKTEILKFNHKLERITEKRKTYIGYRDGIIVEGDVESLVSRFDNLKKKSSSDELEDYKERAAKCTKIIEESKEKLSTFSDDEYDEVEYSFDLERKTEREREKLNGEIGVISTEIGSRNAKISTFEQTMSSIVKAIEPDTIRDRSDIESGLQDKQKALFKKKEKVKENLEDIAKRKAVCIRLDGRINDSQWFDDREYKLSKKIYNHNLLMDMENIYEYVIKELKACDRTTDKLREDIKNKYGELRKEYLNLNNIIDVSLNTIGREVEKEITYKIADLLTKQVELINRNLVKLSADLEVLDVEQSHIINNYVDVAKQYTDELMKIDKNSVLSLEGTRRKMMVIDKLSYDEVTSPRILSMYIKETLNSLISDETLGQDNLGKAIMRELSIESLLEHYCDLNSVIVKFYKVEENIHNSDYKKWEEMLPDNSGGEKFVSFFVLLATLINYSRGNHLKKDASSMTIIMDNPFAAISSQHLLIPLFEYAKQNNIQLICFSDHDKVDIVDRFNTIIRLAITPLANKKEIVEAETSSLDVPVYDEQIDGGYFSYTEQMRLL